MDEQRPLRSRFLRRTDLNHPIGAIMMNAETCFRRLSHEVPNVEEARTIASMIAKDARRAAGIMSRMQQIFDQGARLRESVDVNDVIREMIVLLHGGAARYAVSIHTELMENPSQGVWQIPCN